MTLGEIRNFIRCKAAVSHSRSGGPGGQNVNKVNTKVTLKVPLSEMPLTEEELIRLKEKLASRINSQNELVISSSGTRSQLHNLEEAGTKGAELILKALQKKKKRRKTRPTRGSVERRLSEKKRRSEIKKNRR
jgi:ribosome-associated protein